MGAGPVFAQDRGCHGPGRGAVTPLAALARLSRPSRRGAYALGKTICHHCRIALTHDGFVALVIDVVPTGASVGHQLENLRYDPPRELEIIGPTGKSKIERRAALVCRSSDASLKEAFVRLATALLDTDGAKLGEDVLRDRIDELVSLFRGLSRPAEQTIQGLWTELAIVAWSHNPVAACTAWHSGPRALHDFAGGADRLEVKSCSVDLREHVLRLDQLLEHPGGRTLFASMVVREADDGASVQDLADLVVERVGANAEVKRRLHTIVARSLGEHWRESATRRFDLDDARAKLRFYAASALPTIPRPIPSEINNVSFTIDLSSVPYAPLAEARKMGPFFAELLPRS